MVVVNHFDERFDFAPLLQSLLAHTTCDFDRISFDAGDQGVGEGMLFCACIDWLYDHDLDEKVVRVCIAVGQ